MTSLERKITSLETENDIYQPAKSRLMAYKMTTRIPKNL